MRARWSAGRSRPENSPRTRFFRRLVQCLRAPEGADQARGLALVASGKMGAREQHRTFGRLGAVVPKAERTVAAGGFSRNSAFSELARKALSPGQP